MTLPRIAVVLLAVFAFACAPRAPAPSPAARGQAVEDSVWAAVLDSLYVQAPARILVVRDSSGHRFPHRSPEMVALFSEFCGVEPQTLDSFWARNSVPRPITALPRTRVPVVRAGTVWET